MKKILNLTSIVTVFVCILAFHQTAFAGGAPAAGFVIPESVSAYEDEGSVDVTVTLGGVGAGTYSIDYETISIGGASAGSDYVAASGTLNFTDDGTQTVTIDFIPDGVHESNEGFSVEFSNPTGTVISPDSGSATTVTISNDDFDIYPAADMLGHVDGSGDPVWTEATGLSTSTEFRMNDYPGVALDLTHHRLFVTDSGNNRVLIFNLDSENGLFDREADHVLGQANFTDNGRNGGGGFTISASGLSGPAGLAYDSVNDRLFVADSSNNRVLVFDTASITDNEDAVAVLGVTDLTTEGGHNLIANELNTAYGLAYDESRQYLYVADGGHNRILVFDVAAITNGEDAVHVLGAPDFVTDGFGDGNTNFNTPNAIAYDNDALQLFVADTSNSRVLVFDLSTITDGEAATHILGQSDYGMSSSDVAIDRLSSPSGIAYDSALHRLFVSDHGNNRVVGYEFPDGEITDGMDATYLFGEESFGDSTLGVTTARGTMGQNHNLAFDASNNRLYVVDNHNNRVEIFDLVRIDPTPLVDGAAGEAYVDTVPVFADHGVLAFSAVNLPDGLSIDTDTGEISGVPTEPGLFTFEVSVTDNNTWEGTDFTYRQTFTITITGEGDATAPTVISVTPADGAVDVSSDTTLTITFSEPIETSSFDLALATCDGDDCHAGIMTYDAVWNDDYTVVTVTLNGDSHFEVGVNYLAQVKSAEDEVGNALEDSYTWRFTIAGGGHTSSGGGGRSHRYRSEHSVGTNSGQQVAVFQFTQIMQWGTRGGEVPMLQTFLTKLGFAPGSIDGIYGRQTQAAVKKFQEAHVTEILTPLGLKQGTGMFAQMSLKAANALLQSGAVVLP